MIAADNKIRIIVIFFLVFPDTAARMANAIAKQFIATLSE